MNGRTLGPAAPPPPLELSPSRLRVMRTLAAAEQGATLAELASHLGGHPNATRAHLDALVADGLAERTSEPTGGRGRPTLRWALTHAGRRTLAGDPTVVAYAELVASLADHLARSGADAEAVRGIGRDWGRSRVSPPDADRTATTLDELGFQPERTESGLRLRTCPLLDAASAHPEVVCGVHAGMIQAMSGDPDAELHPFAEPGACVVRWSDPASS